MVQYAEALNSLGAEIHEANIAIGWYDEIAEIKALDCSDALKAKILGWWRATKMMLVVSEVSEAMEGDRKGLQDDKLPHRPMAEVEFADVIIRTLDLGAFLGFDVGGAVQEKRAFNATRADHKRENRAQQGGKAY